MSISLNGYEDKVVTLIAASEVKQGDLVKISANKTVAKCAAGDTFCGVVLSVKDGYAAVKIGGYVTLPYSGTFANLGYQTLASDGSNNVKTVTTGGRSILVVDIDSTGSKTGIIL